VPGCEPVQLLDQIVAGTGPVAGDHDPAPQRGRERGDRLAEQPQVIGGGLDPAEPGRSIQASGSPVLSQAASNGWWP
jgi:hypothetical protein